jgi:signal transduction histidine kinase
MSARSQSRTIKKSDTAAAGRVHSRSEEPTRILFVEDDKVYFSLLKVVIESVKNVAFEVNWATNLETGLEILKERKIDIILLDLMLPDCEGLETFSRFYEKANGTPIIVLSGSTDEKQAMEAVYLGAQDFLIKSQVGVESLVRCIRYTLARLQVAEYRERLQAITDFTAALAHDLRGPLIGAERVLSNMLAREDIQLPADELALLQVLQENNNFLRKKVDALLEVYKLESTINKFEMEAVDASSVLAACLDSQSASLKSGKHKLTSRIEPNLSIMGNVQSLTQLFNNLLDNAMKFSTQGSPIEVSASQNRGMVKITFKDHGQGIANDDLQFLFKKFWRGGTHTFVPGSGLGLYLCEKIVRAHGGVISCESVQEQGSVFSVNLPLLEDEEPAVEPPKRRLRKATK